MNKKFISSLLVLVMILSTFGGFEREVYAATPEPFSLTWNQNKKISEIINIMGRTETQDELVLNWEYGKVAGVDYKKPEDYYIMTYHLTDGEEIEIKVNRASDAKTKIEYRVKKYTMDPLTGEFDAGVYKEANLLAYDQNTTRTYWQYYKNLPSGNLPDSTPDSWRKVDSTSEIWNNSAVNGIKASDSIFAPTGVEMSYVNDGTVYGPNIILDRNTAVAFKYDGNLVTLKWDATGNVAGSGNIFLGIEGIEQSKIYNFNVACQKGTNEYSNNINVIKLLDFEVNPVGVPVIYKENNSADYAGKDPSLNVKFAIPKVWNAYKKKYDDSGVDNRSNKDKDNGRYSDIRGYNGLNATVDLKTSQNGDVIQIKVPNVYDIGMPEYQPTISSNTGSISLSEGSVKLETDGNNNRYYSFELIGEGIKASSLYTVATVLIGATAQPTVIDLSKLQSQPASLSMGKNAYTYLEYDAETMGSGERVIKIKPYNVSGTYYVHKAGEITALPGIRDKFEITSSLIAKYDYLVSSGVTEIEIPVVNNEASYYKIEFVYEKGIIPSQIIYDDPDGSNYLVTPELEVKDYKIITQTNNGVITEKLRVVLSWSGGDATVFEPLVEGDKKVTYTFAKTPFSPREENYTDFLKITADTIVDDVGTATGYTLAVIANEDNNVEAYDGKWGNYETGGVSTVTATSTSGTTKEIKEVIFTAVLEFDIIKNDNLGSRDEPSQLFYYPSVYYMKMNGAYKNIYGEDKQTAYCNPVNVTLDEQSKTILPPPQNIAVSNITTKAFDANWSTVADSVYGEYIETNNYKIDTDNYGAGVNVFLTQKNILSENDAAKQLAYFTDTANIKTIEFKDEGKDGIVTIDVSSVMSEIRNNKMIKITNIPQNVDLQTQAVNIVGLDKNTIYYTALQTLLNVVNVKDEADKKQVVSDSVSQILSVTTKAEDVLVEPDPNEVAPESPSDFREDTAAEQSPTKATLIWTEVEDTVGINEINIKKEYELVRVDKKLQDNLLSKRNKFDDFWSNDLASLSSTQKIAWQTDSTKSSPNNLRLYNDTDKAFVLDVTKTENKYSYEYEKRNPTLEFVDDMLLPNHIYYYYIRTVRMSEVGGVYVESAYSSWEPVVITTNPIKAPIDLQLERNTTYFSYDKEKEVVISFFAAIPMGTSTADIASLYPLEYSIMEDGGDWKNVAMNVTNSSVFKLGNVKKEGYQQFVYKITDLTQGKGYSIRVRMRFRVNPITETVGVYDVSLYSNTVEFRTDMNQGEYDTEEGIKKWLGLFDDELLAKSTKNYWVINNSNSNYEAIYRTLTFDGELQKTNSGVYTFEAEGQDKQIYYIPAKTLSNSNTANIGFKLVNGDMEVLIRPNSMDINTTESIGKILSKIKEGSVKDYYVKIEANWVTSKETINGSEALSDQVQIKMSVIGSKALEKTLDARFVQVFNEAINSTSNRSVRNELKVDLKAEIAGNATNEALYELVVEAVGEAYEGLIEVIEDDFDDNTNYNYSISALEENMLITAAVSGQSTVSGYIKNNTTWEIIPTSHYGSKKGFETKLLGVFVFAGKVINMPDVTGIINSEAVKDLIVKYGLDDYFGKDIINVNTNATKYMVVGSIARLSGAVNTQSEVTYLKGKGVNVTTGKMYNEISNQEALYLVMSLYEIKTGTKISTIRITNYNAVPDSVNIDANYKKSVQAAAQLGIYTDMAVSAKSNITVRTLLEYLGRLSNKIKL